MAATVTAYQQYGFSSPEELDEACSAAYTAMRESLTELKQMEKTLDGKKELQRQVLAYFKTRPVRDGLKQQKNAKAKSAYRQKHESDFIIADAAARYFRENGISKLEMPFGVPTGEPGDKDFGDVDKRMKVFR